MYKLFKILLAEDDDNSAKIVMHVLDRYNFSVTHVPDGMAALSKVRINEYDLIISDIMMPYLDGLSFVEKAKEFSRDTPVILLTAVGERKNVLRAAKHLVSFYILKPIELDTIMEKIMIAMNIDQSQLYEKKQFPFTVRVSEGVDNSLSVFLDGCPKKNSGEEIASITLDALKSNKEILELNIIIHETFFLEAMSFRVLDDFLLKILRNTKIRSGNIRVFAPEVRAAKLDPDRFPNLLSCKFESRT